MSSMHFGQLADLFKQQGIRTDPGNEKKNPLHVLLVPDSFVAKNSCLEHSRHLLSAAVELSPPTSAPDW